MIVEASDWQATREYFAPGLFTNPFSSDFDTEVRNVSSSICRIGTKDQDTLLIENIIANVNNYITNQSVQNIEYPAVYQQFNDGFVNSNSWANSLIDSVYGTIDGGTDFDGLDALGDNRIPLEYFKANPSNLPIMNQ